MQLSNSEIPRGIHDKRGRRMYYYIVKVAKDENSSEERKMKEQHIKDGYMQQE
jgi:hypothetical protein